MKGDVFHILNRGIEKREIFYSEKDYLRFVHNLFDFNDTAYSLPYPQRSKSRQFSNQQFGHRMSKEVSKEVSKEEIVDLLCWCLMPNHIHNLVMEKINGGASNFSKKIFGGYTKYINEQKKRSGVLFQGRSKIISVKQDHHFFYLPFYIMANPIDLIEPNWKEKGIKNLGKVIQFLENYCWSSFPDLIGKENFSFVINKNLFYEIFQTDAKEFKKNFIEWLKSYKEGYSFGKFID
jgi:putative transposase